MKILSRAILHVSNVTGCLFIVGCSLIGPVNPTTDVTPSSAETSSPPQTSLPSPTPPLDTGWESLQLGLERRVVNLYSENGGLQENLYMLRIDPTLFTFRVGYRPGEPQSLEAWQQETGALIVLNGGFFDENDAATGLVIADGQSFGVSYQGFGGMFAVDDEGPKIIWLQQEPFTEDASLHSALQSFPMLLIPGGQLPPQIDSGDAARRTVLSRDSEGRIVVIVANLGYFSLSEMSQYLANSDLGLDRALNLDGGASSGVYLASPGEVVSSFSPLPTVVLVYNK